ncbi:hypothetical protein AAC387_Pa05g0619 [Persea americana]
MAVESFVDWKGKTINPKRHGGTRAASFIYALVVALNISFVSTMINVVTYLQKVMHMGVGTASTNVTNFIGMSCAFALLGGFLSDSYMTRFKTILIFGPVEFLGYGLLALQAHVPSLRPPECDVSNPESNCKGVHGYNAALLYVAIYLVALGEGCIRANLASFGGDQFDEDDPNESKHRSSFFNWFTVGISIGAITGLIFIVWIEDHKGWDYGFAACALIVILGMLVLIAGSPFYRNQQPKGSPLTRMLQVFVAAFRNRRLVLPENEVELYQEVVKEEMVNGEFLPHTKNFKFLDKASISYGDTRKWSLCSVTQVEETKIILQMAPVFISAVICYMPISQLLTFTVEQGGTMNTKLGSIHISPATLLVIPIIMQAVILVVYDRLFVPFARRITGYRTGITHLQRIGISFLTTPIATCVAAVIEKKRKTIAAEHGLIDSGTGVPMSIMWLLLQFFAVGLNDAFAFVGLLEFFNSEASKGMKSIGTAIFWCVFGLSSLLASLVVGLANKATKHRHGGMGWLEGNNLNKSYLDRFYWLLSVFGFVGFFNYLIWAKRYVYRQPIHVPTS